MLKLAQAELPRLEVREFHANTRKGRLLLEALCERAEVPEELRLVVPAVFVGRDALIKDQITDEGLRKMLESHGEQDAIATWEVTESELAAARGRLIARFGRIGVLSVVAGGLIDQALAPWVGRWAQAVLARAEQPVYRAHARLLSALLSTE